MLENTLPLLLGQQIKRSYDNMCRGLEQAYGLTRNEIDVLLFLANNPDYDTARDIVELRALTKSHVCKSVESLASRGFLRGEQDLRDRRCIHLKILPEAATVVAACQEVQQAFIQAIYQGITDEERTVMDRVSYKMLENLKGGACRGR